MEAAPPHRCSGFESACSVVVAVNGFDGAVELIIGTLLLAALDVIVLLLVVLGYRRSKREHTAAAPRVAAEV